MKDAKEGGASAANVTMVWANAKDLTEKVASVPLNWLDRFAAAHPEHTRKFGAAQNSRLVYRVSAVLEAVEKNELMRG